MFRTFSESDMLVCYVVVSYTVSTSTMEVTFYSGVCLIPVFLLVFLLANSCKNY